jgi:hypothetical protein
MGATYGMKGKRQGEMRQEGRRKRQEGKTAGKQTGRRKEREGWFDRW